METASEIFSPEQWLNGVFSAKAVASGQVVRRKKRDIERYIGMDRFLRELSERGFQAVQNRDQIVIFCNHAPVIRLV